MIYLLNMVVSHPLKGQKMVIFLHGICVGISAHGLQVRALAGPS